MYGENIRLLIYKKERDSVRKNLVLIAGYDILKFCKYMADEVEDNKALKGWWVIGFTFFGPKNGLEIFLKPVQIN